MTLAAAANAHSLKFALPNHATLSSLVIVECAGAGLAARALTVAQSPAPQLRMMQKTSREKSESITRVEKKTPQKERACKASVITMLQAV